MNDSKQKNLPEVTILQTTQKNLAMLGIIPKLVTQSCPLSGKILSGFLLLSTSSAFVCVYIINDAKTFIDYTQSVYIASVGILLFFEMLILILKVEELYKFVNRCNGIINTSE